MAANPPLPPLPSENEDPWIDAREAFDQAVKDNLENRLSDPALSAAIAEHLDVQVPGAVAGVIADDPSVAEAAAALAQSDAGLVRKTDPGILAEGRGDPEVVHHWVDAEGKSWMQLHADGALTGDFVPSADTEARLLPDGIKSYEFPSVRADRPVMVHEDAEGKGFYALRADGVFEMTVTRALTAGGTDDAAEGAAEVVGSTPNRQIYVDNLDARTRANV